MRRCGKAQRNAYLKQFDDSFWLLAENPDIGKTCDEIRAGYRKFPQGSHVIFYQQTGNQQIRVIRILHKSMDVSWVCVLYAIQHAWLRNGGEAAL